MSEVGVNRHKKPKTGGRKRGTPNKLTQLAKDVIAGAAEDLGGQQRLVEWAQEDPANERVFWGNIYPKLLPLTLSGDPKNPLSVAWPLPKTSLDR